MNSKTGSVDCQETNVIRVRSFLLSKGFGTADKYGVAGSPFSSNIRELGILYKDPGTKPRTYLFGLIKREPPRDFIGILWFDDIEHGATEQNWVFEVYGRKCIELARQLAEDVASNFNTKISLRLEREEPKVEISLSEWLALSSGCDDM